MATTGFLFGVNAGCIVSAVKRYLSSQKGELLMKRWDYMIPEDETGCPLCNSSRRSLYYELGRSKALKCSDCGMKYVSPRLSRNQLSKYYADVYKDPLFGKDFEGRKHDVFNDDEERRRKIRDRHYEIDTTMRFVEKGRILDIGSGAGLYFEGLKGSYDLHGIEVSPVAAEYVAKRFNAQVFVGDTDDAEYGEGAFDVINMTYVVEHLLAPLPTMQKVVRWLRKGGLLLVSSPNWGGIVPKLYREFFRLNDPCQHINLWDTKSIGRFLHRLGLNDVKIYFPFFRTEYFNRYEVGRLFRNSFIRLFFPAFIRLGYFPEIEKLLSPPFWGNIMVVRCTKE